jgi:hypothetical protein
VVGSGPPGSGSARDQQVAGQEQRREAAGEKDRPQPADRAAVVGDAEHEPAQQRHRAQRQQKAEYRAPLQLRPRDLANVRGSQHRPGDRDRHRHRLQRRQVVAGQDHGQQHGDRGVAGDDRAQDRDRSDRQRPVERQVGHPANRSDGHEHRDLAGVDMRERVGGQRQDRERDQRREVKAQHDPQRAGAARGHGREVVGQPPGQRGAQAERDPH